MRGTDEDVDVVDKSHGAGFWQPSQPSGVISGLPHFFPLHLLLIILIPQHVPSPRWCSVQYPLLLSVVQWVAWPRTPLRNVLWIGCSYCLTSRRNWATRAQTNQLSRPEKISGDLLCPDDNLPELVYWDRDETTNIETYCFWVCWLISPLPLGQYEIDMIMLNKNCDPVCQFAKKVNRYNKLQYFSNSHPMNNLQNKRAG